MEVPAIYKYAKFSAQKGRLVVDRIRGMKVESALNVLKFSPKRAAKAVRKVLESAIANAEHNYGMDIDELYVKIIYVDEGPMLKRIQARAKGRADRILKRWCHITVKVAEKEEGRD